ncbi:MAG: M20 family peptidase [Clostridia bacterium]|nr:M20 family peptidase [Clostridia bacterium]
MSIIKKTLLIVGVVLIIFFTIIIVRTITFKSKQIKEVKPIDMIKFNDERIINHISQALKYKTISFTDATKFDYNEFDKLNEYIEQSFPNIHKNLKREIVNQHSLLYTWEGKDRTLEPIMLTAHTDVVGVEEETENDWIHSPFSGDIADGKIWGRGARDNKSQVTSILEAVEYLLGNGFTPKRTIYIALGHDEEVLGINGAAKIAELLKSRKVTLDCVIDEGGAIQDKAIPGIKEKVALIGIGEKGYLTLELSVNTKGGHSSSPVKSTSVGILSNAIVCLEKSRFSSSLIGIKPMFEFAAPEMKFPYNMIASNLWATGGIIKKIMDTSPETNASIRTTGVVTIYGGGFKDNVIPSYASATMNFRILPGDTVDSVIKHVKEIIDDSRVNTSVIGFNNNPPPVSSVETNSFKKIQASIKQVFPDTISVPYLVTGGTDSKHYSVLTPNLYRFTPSIKEKDENSHGINERIPIDNYKQYIMYYIQIIKNFQN